MNIHIHVTRAILQYGLGPGAGPFLDPETWDMRPFSSWDPGPIPFLNLGPGTWGTLRGA
jgi:hypothetical protein